MTRSSLARTSRNTGLGLLAAVVIGLSPHAAADDALDLSFFKNSKCSATQIYHAMERVAPAEIAQIKSGPIGSRRQKWLMNWLIRTREAVDAGSMIPNFESSSGGQFGDVDWRKIFAPHQDQIAADCPNE
ncbi:hypothetical protein Srot_2828 [Segniliparus rotundus DSM 44985]|uniref:Secreted protein n=1 Tax=Segniliparus rotundus (strain ATCC BAA-972 / CDC 1076 / CIP 108378 / DSM 44985 / JCM 13578) TaxID=640132 RepID=D6ZD72_SEGRD|nr:hypothetical protein [Segniliparus rotundus]ADG99259.1 hypothetical protein Srot_2828 [Segniliparus rotundus DSM 44985]